MCDAECVAGDVDVALTVPVAAKTVADEAVARVFAAEAARVPARRDGRTFAAAVDSENVLLHAYPPDAAAIAPGAGRDLRKRPHHSLFRRRAACPRPLIHRNR